MKDKPTNIGASVTARLLNRTRQSGEDYQVILGSYCTARFLYRIGVSVSRDRFVLKGATLLRLLSDPDQRERLNDISWRSIEAMARRPTDAEYSHHLRLLTQAWAERRTVRFTYDASIHDRARRSREAVVRPWYLEPSLATHALYLIGWDETRDAVRTFKVDRIRDLSVTPHQFEPPEGTIDQAMRSAWDIIADQPATDVVLRFDAAVAARVRETTWHPSERVELATDGSLTWRARVSGTIEIRVWILQWGHQVEVLEPAELRDEVAAIHRVAAARYEDDGTAAGAAARGVVIR